MIIGDRTPLVLTSRRRTINKIKKNRRRLLTAISIGGAGATLKWSTPIVDSFLLPAHATTSVVQADQFPMQLAGIWIARYTTRPGFFRLTISENGSASIFQEITTVFGIPIVRSDSLELQTLSLPIRQVVWRSLRTQIAVSYDRGFTQIEGLEQIGSQTPAAFLATLI